MYTIGNRTEKALGNLLASQSQTLKRLLIESGHCLVSSLVSFLKLEQIEIHGATIDSCENLFGSLPALKHLTMTGARLFPHTAPFPLSPSPHLESLTITKSPEMDERLEKWLDENSASLPSLRKLTVGTITARALSSILSNSPMLMELRVQPNREERLPNTEVRDEHLEAISKFAPSSLQTLTLYWGKYSSLGIDAFIASCPASITSLDISFSAGLTPSQLRALFRLSQLRILGLMETTVRPEHFDEMNLIAEGEKPAGLSLRICGLKKARNNAGRRRRR